MGPYPEHYVSVSVLARGHVQESEITNYFASKPKCVNPCFKALFRGA